MTAYLYRMPVGIAGAISRPQDLTVEPVILKSANAFAAYGLAGKYDADGFFVPLADGDTADKVKGIYVRPYPTTSQPDMVRQVGTDKNFPGDAMKRGYMTVNLGSDFDASTIKKGDPVTTLIIALGLLWDDYQTWKEGGKSLIDWGKWKTEIDQAVKMIGDLKKTVTDLTKALAKLLGIDPKSWSLKWDFSNFISQMGEFGKMLNMIADLLNAIKDGNWAQAASIGKQLLNQGSGQPSATPAVEDSANRSADWVKENLGFDPRSVGRTIRGWFGDDEPDQHAQSAKAPRGIRNNNPGNIDFRGQSGATLERPGGRFARFETAYDGLKALSRQLMRYFEGKTTGKPLQTLNDIISTWAPGNENNTGAYIAQLSKMMGVAPDAILNLKDPQVMSSLMNGIIHHENGRNPYPSELVRMAAGGGASQNIQQETVINIHGVSDPREAANITVERQKNVNSQLTQQLRTVPS